MCDYSVLQVKQRKRSSSQAIQSKRTLPKLNLPADVEERESSPKAIIRKKQALCKTHKDPKACELSIPSGICSARTVQIFPKIIACIEHLTNTNSFTHQGIFRECGDYSKILKAYEDLKTANSNQYSYIFEPLTPIDTADLLKMLISKMETPLIDEETLTNFEKLCKLVAVMPQDEKILENQLKKLYINSVTTALPGRLFSILCALFKFLLQVVEHKEQSKMDVINIATIFAPLVLPPPSLQDIHNFMEVNKGRISLLAHILLHFQEEPLLFQPRYSCGKYEVMEATKSGEWNGEFVIRGDSFAVFHRTSSIICGILGDRMFVLSIAKVEPLFTSGYSKEKKLFGRLSKTPRNFTRRFSLRAIPM